MVKEVKVNLSHSLNEAEWKTLTLYCEKVQRLLATKMLSGESGGIKANGSFRPNTGIVFSASLPPEEQIAEFLMAFRFFYLQKESTYFPSILSLLGKYANQDDAKLALKSFGSRWKNSLFAGSLVISIDGKQVTASKLFDLWFNAHYFHGDEVKQIDLDELKLIFTEPFAKYMLLDASLEATRVIYIVYDGMRAMIDSRKNTNRRFKSD